MSTQRVATTAPTARPSSTRCHQSSPPLPDDLDGGPHGQHAEDRERAPQAPACRRGGSRRPRPHTAGRAGAARGWPARTRRRPGSRPARRRRRARGSAGRPTWSAGGPFAGFTGRVQVVDVSPSSSPIGTSSTGASRRPSTPSAASSASSSSLAALPGRAASWSSRGADLGGADDAVLHRRGVLVDVLLAGQEHQLVHDLVGDRPEDEPVVLHALVAGEVQRRPMRMPMRMSCGSFLPVGWALSVPIIATGSHRDAGLEGHPGDAGAAPVEPAVGRAGALGVDAEQLAAAEHPQAGVAGRPRRPCRRTGRPAAGRRP